MFLLSVICEVDTVIVNKTCALRLFSKQGTNKTSIRSFGWSRYFCVWYWIHFPIYNVHIKQLGPTQQTYSLIITSKFSYLQIKHMRFPRLLWLGMVTATNSFQFKSTILHNAFQVPCEWILAWITDNKSHLSSFNKINLFILLHQWIVSEVFAIGNTLLYKSSEVFMIYRYNNIAIVHNSKFQCID